MLSPDSHPELASKTPGEIVRQLRASAAYALQRAPEGDVQPAVAAIHGLLAGREGESWGSITRLGPLRDYDEPHKEDEPEPRLLEDDLPSQLERLPSPQDPHFVDDVLELAIVARYTAADNDRGLPEWPWEPYSRLKPQDVDKEAQDAAVWDIDALSDTEDGYSSSTLDALDRARDALRRMVTAVEARDWAWHMETLLAASIAGLETELLAHHGVLVRRTHEGPTIEAVAGLLVQLDTPVPQEWVSRLLPATHGVEVPVGRWGSLRRDGARRDDPIVAAVDAWGQSKRGWLAFERWNSDPARWDYGLATEHALHAVIQQGLSLEPAVDHDGVLEVTDKLIGELAIETHEQPTPVGRLVIAAAELRANGVAR